MAFHAYMLRYADGSYYTGHTDDLEQRLAAHQTGALRGYTASRRPVELVWSDMFRSRQEAFERERQIKGWRRSKKQALIEQHWSELRVLARGHGSTGSP